MSEPQESQRTGGPLSWLAAIGPAIIVASVVLGPGSILISSRVGAEYGYEMLWILVLSVVLMIALVALAARLGSVQEGSMCDELAARVGRPVTVLVGLIVFLIIACFQTSNNMAVRAVVESLLGRVVDSDGQNFASIERLVSAAVLVGFNAFVILLLFSLSGLYKKLERLMKFMVGLMAVAFVANFIAAGPSLWAALTGLIPHIPADGVMPVKTDGAIIDPLWAVQGMVMTTFSVAGAFYQAYLVRERGWSVDRVKDGFRDSLIGISTLGILTAMIMMTAAATLHGRVEPKQLQTVPDVAAQMEPLFGPTATVLLSIGLFAAAFNPFIINAVIGGTIFSDSMRLGARIDDLGPKALTTAALAVGMGVALLNIVLGVNTIGVIIFAQALTVLGVPVLAIAMLYLAMRHPSTGERAIPIWMKITCGVAVFLTLILAIRTAWRLWLTLT